jgi:hypothetical protein
MNKINLQRVLCLFLIGWNVWATSDICVGRCLGQVEAQKFLPPDLKQIEARLAAIANFAPSDNYSFLLTLLSGNGRKKEGQGSMEGWRSDEFHRVHCSLEVAGTTTTIYCERPDGPITVRRGEEAPVSIGPSEWLTPLVAGTAICPFNICPFNICCWVSQWDLQVKGCLRKKGRLSWQVFLSPPKDIRNSLPNLEYVEIILDQRFDAFMEMTAYGTNGEVLAYVKVLSFKNSESQGWYAKDFRLQCGSHRNRLIADKAKPD